MSWQAVKAVLAADFPDLPAGPGRRKGVSALLLNAVCLVLAESAGEDGTDARVAIRVIARGACTTPDSVRIALDGLLELGAITVRRPARGSAFARYDVALDALPGLCKTRESARPSRAQTARPSRARRAAQPRESARPSRANPSIHPVTPARCLCGQVCPPGRWRCAQCQDQVATLAPVAELVARPATTDQAIAVARATVAANRDVFALLNAMHGPT